MLPWFRLMTVEDIEKAIVLAKTKTLEEIVALATVRHRKDERIKLAILASCLVPFGVLIAMTLLPSDQVSATIWIWVAAICVSLILPVPMIRYGKLGHKEGRIISLAWHLKRDPRLVVRKKQ